MRSGTLRLALARRFQVPTVRARQILSDSVAQHAPVQPLPSSNVVDCGHYFSIDQTATHRVVPGDLLYNAGEKRDLRHGTAPVTGYFLQRGVASKTEADASDDGT